MDTQTGNIYQATVIKSLIDSGAIQDRSRFKPMDLPPTPRQMARKPPRIGRNEPCPCGSGKKFKQCCLHNPKDDRFSGGK